MRFCESISSRACLSARYSYKERRDLRVSPFFCVQFFRCSPVLKIINPLSFLCETNNEFFSSRRELSNPRRELLNPRRELSNLRRGLKNNSAEFKL